MSYKERMANMDKLFADKERVKKEYFLHFSDGTQGWLFDCIGWVDDNVINLKWDTTGIKDVGDFKFKPGLGVKAKEVWEKIGREDVSLEVVRSVLEVLDAGN